MSSNLFLYQNIFVFIFDQRNVASKSSLSEPSSSIVLIDVCIIFIFYQRIVAIKSSLSKPSHSWKLIYIYICLCSCLNLSKLVLLSICICIHIHIWIYFSQRNVATKSSLREPSPPWKFIPSNWLLLNHRVKLNFVNARILQVMGPRWGH